MFYQVQQHIALLEAYIDSPAPDRFIESLNNPTEKIFLKLLTTPVSNIQQYKKDLNKIEVNQNLKTAILNYKLEHLVHNLKSTPDRKTLQQLKNHFASYLNFNYEKPANVRREELAGDEEVNTARIGVLSKDEVSYINQKVSEDGNFLFTLEPMAIDLLSEKTLLNLDFQVKDKLFRHFKQLQGINPILLEKLFQAYYTEYIKINKIASTLDSFHFPYEKLTKQQLIQLSKKHGDLFHNVTFCREWLSQHYRQFTQEYSKAGSQPIEKERQNLEILIKIQEEVQKNSKSFSFRMFQYNILTQIIETESLLKEAKYPRLIQYLNNDISLYSYYPHFTQKFKSKLSNRSTTSLPVVQQHNNILQSQGMRLRGSLKGMTQLVEDYLIELFKATETEKLKKLVEKLSEMIELNYLRKMEVKVKLMRGEKCQEATDYWEHKELVQLKQKKEVKLNERNKKIYKAQDEVKVSLTLKNVRQLEIKIYELNLLKEYLTNNSDTGRNYEDINLSYFSPSSVELFTNRSENPFEWKEVEILLKTIPNRIGIFVVDIQGEGITSRAVIRKGAIVCLENYSHNGQSFEFFDEDGNKLNEKQGLRVWLEKKQVSLSEDSVFNTSSVEPKKRNSNTQIIASLGCFAQKFTKSTLQDYQLQLKVIYTPENFINENKARILLKSSLILNGSPVSQCNLKNIRAIVNQLTGQVITSSNTFEFKKWQDNREQLVEFFPQADINSINVQIKACLEDGKEVSVHSNRVDINITSNSQQQEKIIGQPYLSFKGNQEYQLAIKGKNGEALANKEVTLEFEMKHTRQREKFKFITDVQGSISLGKLTAVRALYYSYHPINRTWPIDRTLDFFNYDQVIYAFPGQQITLPVHHSWTNKDIMLLHYGANRVEKNDQSEQIKIKDGYMNFTVGNLNSSYKLTIYPVGVCINIEVLADGQRWKNKHNNKNVIISPLEGKISIIERPSALRNIHITKYTFKSTENNTTLCELNFNSSQILNEEQLKQVRVHIFATNYMTPSLYGGFQGNQYFRRPELQEQCRPLNKSTYLSNKTLSEEAAYIVNRQKENKRIGSNLEKPGLFLKRLAVRETKNVVGELVGEGQFQLQDNENQNRRVQAYAQRAKLRQERNITKHNNFLASAGFLKHNLGPKATFEIPSDYTHVEIYLITPEHASKSTLGIPCHQSKIVVKNKDIRFKGLAPCKEGHSWNISRQVYTVKEAQKTNFSKKCEHKVVTLKEVFEYAEKITFASTGERLYSWKDQLLLWQGYTQEQKLKTYNKYYCHELNTFLKFKDPAFFKEIVLPFITNKLKKTFIDSCLLQDPIILDHLSINRLLQLNNFECALFVYTLVKMNKNEQAKRVTERMQLQFAKDLPFKIKSKLFDLVINSFVGKEEVTTSINLNRYQEQQFIAQNYPAPVNRNFQRRMSEDNCSEASYLASVCEFAGQGQAPIPLKLHRQTSQANRSQSQDEIMLGTNMMMPQQQIGRNSNRIMAQQVAPKPKNNAQTTNEFTEQTYFYQEGEKYPLNEYKKLASPFWAELAQHFLEGGQGNFTSSSFVELKSGLQVILAAAFIPGRESDTFTLGEDGDKYELSANITLSLFVKEQKQYAQKGKEGVYIYQTISTMSTIEPNKEIIASEIRAGELYYLSTIFSNSTSDFIDLQILCPVPQGSIPLMSKDVTILQHNLGPFKTEIHKQAIYFPVSGMYTLPPANILDMNSDKIIASSPVNLPISVIKPHEGKKLESFQDIIQYGSKAEILQFLKTKNIFSSETFKPELILWMLSDSDFFLKVVGVLRNRFYFDRSIWSFSLLHGNPQALSQYIKLQQYDEQTRGLNARLSKDSFQTLAFEYFPYFQKRTHRYANQNRSAIKNADMKQTYIKFLVAMSISNQYRQPEHQLTHTYYLTLQDRLAEAQKIVDALAKTHPERYQLQLDYIRCFLDMGLNGEKCEVARKIAPKYLEYPIASWKKLFSQIMETLKEPPPNQHLRKETLETKVTRLDNGAINITRSPKKEIKIEIFPTNMELFFTEHPFDLKQSISNFSISKPSRQILIPSSDERTQITLAASDLQDIKNPYIEISEHGEHSHKRIKSLLWANPRITTKVHESVGIIQLFVDGKRAIGSYVKVFTIPKGSKRTDGKAKYYVDGYTDIAGQFKYGLTDLQLIEEFALLAITEVGAVVRYAAPPKAKTENGLFRKRSSSSSSASSDGSDSS